MFYDTLEPGDATYRALHFKYAAHSQTESAISLDEIMCTNIHNQLWAAAMTEKI